MKTAKAPRVPVLENAFEVNLPKLMRAAKASGSPRLVLSDSEVRTVALLTETRLAVFLGGRPWVVDVVLVQCLKDRVRPLLKCPRAHEGNFQSLYYRNGELACRHCHQLRYQSNLAAKAAGRARIARAKLLSRIGAEPGQLQVERRPFTWHHRHRSLSARLAELHALHYADLRSYLMKRSAQRTIS